MRGSFFTIKTGGVEPSCFYGDERVLLDCPLCRTAHVSIEFYPVSPASGGVAFCLRGECNFFLFGAGLGVSILLDFQEFVKTHGL